MNTEQKHIIQTVCFDAGADSEESAVAFADALSGLNCGQLFNDVLSRYSTATETIRLQKVEIDIGDFNVDNLYNIEEELLQKFEVAIKQQIKTSENKKQTVVFASANKNTTSSIDAKATNDVDMLSPENCIELILNYFKTGQLPWYITSQPDIEKLITSLLQHNSAMLKKYLLPHLNNERVIKRMVVTLQYKVIVDLVKTLTWEPVFYPVETFISMVKKAVPAAEIEEFNKKIAVIYLNVAAKSEKGIHVCADALINQMKNILLYFPDQVLKTLVAEIQQLLHKKNSTEFETIYKSMLIQISKITDSSKYLSQNQILAKSNADSSGSIDSATIVKPAADKYIKELGLNPEPADTESEDDTANYFIDNAGLVLLNAALLQKTFEGLGWVKEKKITDEKSRDKILLWMDYLVWGKRKTHEYGLMLNKVLTGLQPWDIVDISQTLTAAEMHKAVEVLETVIQHWTILKNTSVDGFRNSFLQRNARLSNEDGGWQLFVEAKGYDILLDSLPWSFSIIKFPWMEKPLFTQWQTKV